MEEKFKTYLFEYVHDGQAWGLEVKASSPEDAQDRVLRMPNARYLGVMQMQIPAELGVFARLVCWIRNRAPRHRR